MLIALTGGIGAGKSTIAARLAGRGAVVVDADRVAREVVEPGTPALAAIAETFGRHVLRADGSLDRAALGAIVFADDGARHRLNAITHPAVQERSVQAFRTALDADPDAVVVYDVPLIEARGHDEFDGILVADAPAAVRIDRLVALRGMTREQATARVEAQIGDDDRRALATWLIDTSGTLEQTLAQTDLLWERLSGQRLGGDA